MQKQTIRCIAVFALAAVVFGLANSGDAQAQSVEVDAEATVRYVLSCQKPNGSFGPRDQEYADLAWTVPAVQALRLLNAEVPRARDCFENTRADTWRFPYWDFYNLTQLHRELGAKPSAPLESAITLKHQPIGELHWVPEFTIGRSLVSYHDLTSLWQVVEALAARNCTVSNVEDVIEYVRPWQKPEGDFAGHVVLTGQTVMALRGLGADVPGAERCAAWIRACQTPSGGFRYSPTESAPSNQPDVLYTHVAVRALAALGSEPADAGACVRWINTLQNSDGGFGDRPGWNSRLASTYDAVGALTVLRGDAREAITKKSLPQAKIAEIPAGKYKIFQAHHKSPQGGPEMVEAVRKLGLDLVGVKGWTEGVNRLRDYVKEQGYSMEIVALPENYDHRMRLTGVPDANHISNFIIPPEMSSSQHDTYRAAKTAGAKGLSWTEFKRQVIAPMLDMGTLFYPEHDYGLVHAYMMYDDGLDGGPGYNAIHATHFGDKRPDWIRLYPYRERWLGRLPFLADGDAHGDIHKWTPELNRARVLYLAKEPWLADYLEACRSGRTVCVLRDPSVPSGVVYYGSPEAVRYVKHHRDAWQWW